MATGQVVAGHGEGEEQRKHKGKQTGDGAEARALAARMADSFIAFARTGDPNTAALPAWPTYDLQRRGTMIFDTTCRIENDPRREERLLFAVAPYIKPGG